MDARPGDEASGEHSADVTPLALHGPARARPIPARRSRPKRSINRLEIPSGLLSLMTHLMVLAVIGALAWTPRAPHPVTPIFLTLSLTQGDDDTNLSPLSVAAIQSQPTAEQDHAAGAGAAADADPKPADDSRQPADTPLDARPAEAKRIPPESARPTTVRKPIVMMDQMAEAQSRRLLAMRDAAGLSIGPMDGGGLPDQADEIVNRFILYDVGRLPGEAGLQARQDFHRLGPEAIPALVRGLNKAAALRASCPIAVISSRLMSLLGQSHDRGMIRYALENIGRGVKPTDPHYRSVQSLVRRLEKVFLGGGSPPSAPVTSSRRKWWMPPDWQEP